MKPNYLLYCALAIFTAACTGPGDRSVNEEIPLDELNRLLVKEPDYQTAIVVAERFRETASTIQRAKANDLTYRRLHEFLTEFLDADLRTCLEVRADEEWAGKYGTAYDRADTIAAYWQNYVETHKPESYVKVELTGIVPAESSYGTARVVLTVTPLKGPIEKVAGTFGLFPRGQAPSFGDFSPARHNFFEFNEGLKGPTRREAWMNYSIWDIRDGDIPYTMYPDNPGLSIEELLEKYVFDYSVTTLEKDGKTIQYADVWYAVPASVRAYWSGKQHEEHKEALRGEIVRELIDAEFPDRETYRSGYVRQYYHDLDSLAAWLMYELL